MLVELNYNGKWKNFIGILCAQRRCVRLKAVIPTENWSTLKHVSLGKRSICCICFFFMLNILQFSASNNFSYSLYIQAKFVHKSYILINSQHRARSGVVDISFNITEHFGDLISKPIDIICAKLLLTADFGWCYCGYPTFSNTSNTNLSTWNDFRYACKFGRVQCIHKAKHNKWMITVGYCLNEWARVWLICNKSLWCCVLLFSNLLAHFNHGTCG